MAAEAQRATCLRERTSIVPRLPRVPRIGSMERAARRMHEPETPRVELALEVFNSLNDLPDSFIVQRALDASCASLIRRGEVVVADAGSSFVTGGWLPVEGHLFLIEYCSPPTACELYARRSRRVVQTFTDHRGRWWTGGLRRGLQGREFIVDDGPYGDEQQLADKLIAKVVGLYRPGAPTAVRS